jgi:hypothetical protein
MKLRLPLNATAALATDTRGSHTHYLLGNTASIIFKTTVLKIVRTVLCVLTLTTHMLGA